MSSLRRSAVPARFLMCRPEHLDPTFTVGAWLQPQCSDCLEVALRQWTGLTITLEELGHHVELVAPDPGVPEMVFVADGALIHGNRAAVARSHRRRRNPSSGTSSYETWLTAAGYDVHQPEHPFGGASDVAVLPGRGMALAAHGPRTDRRSHDEISRWLGLDVVSIELADDRFRHLDTALSALDDHTALYVPDAFTAEGEALIASVFPDAFAVPHGEAKRLAANTISDGGRVVLPHEARITAAWLRNHGFRPVPLPVTELRRSGGGLGRCVLRLGPGAVGVAQPGGACTSESMNG